MPAYLGQNGCGSGHAWVRLGCIRGSRWNRAGLNRLLNRRKCGKRGDSEGILRFGGLVSVFRGSSVGAGNCLWVFSIRRGLEAGSEFRLGLLRMRKEDLQSLNGRKEVGQIGAWAPGRRRAGSFDVPISGDSGWVAGLGGHGMDGITKRKALGTASKVIFPALTISPSAQRRIVPFRGVTATRRHCLLRSTFSILRTWWMVPLA